MKNVYLVIVLVAGICGHLPGQEVLPPKKRNFTQRIIDDGVVTFQTVVGTYARPLTWKKREWMQFGGAMAISAASVLLDQPVFRFSERNQTPFLDDLERVGDFLGQPENNYPFMIAVWGTGVIANNDWLRDTGLMIFASVTTSGIVQTLSKSLVGRARPATGEGELSFNPYGGVSYHSFPSGHTMLAVATSWILARRVNFLPAKIVFYGVPVLVGWSRLYGNAHWFSDIVLGSFLGIACAETILRIFPLLREARTQKFTVLPMGAGMRVAYRF